MTKATIGAHERALVMRHEIPCGECTGPKGLAQTASCPRCHGTRSVGNCRECVGAGFFSTSTRVRGEP